MRNGGLWKLVAVVVLSARCGSGAPIEGAPDAGTDAANTAVCPEGTPLTILSGKLAVEVLIDGVRYRFILDTGAPQSVVDDSIATKIGAGPYELTVAGVTARLGSLRSEPLRAQLNLASVDGVLGGDVVGQYALTLDYPRKRFWLEATRDEAALGACAHVERAPVEVSYFQDAYGYLYVPGRAETRDGWLLIDSGASLGAINDSVFDALQASQPRPALQGFYTPAAVGTFWARLTSIGWLEVAGRRVEHLITRTISDEILEVGGDFPDGGALLGLLPSGYLRHFMVTLDFPAGRLRLDAEAGKPLREPSGWFVTGIGLEETTTAPVHVAQVLAGSSAEEAGVQPGDEVVSVNGAAFATLSPAARPWALASSAEGTRFAVALRRNGAALDVTLTARDQLVDPKLP